MKDYFKHFYEYEEKVKNEESKPENQRCKQDLQEFRRQKNNYRKLAVEQIRKNKTFEMRKVIPFTDSYKVKNNHNNIKLIIQYYDEKNINRRDEVVQTIKNNIYNKLINKIFLYVEYSDKSRSVNEQVKDLGNIDLSKVEIIPTTRRLTYLEAIVKAKLDKDDDAVYLLCNNDCYFDASVGLLKKINFQNGNLIGCMTRKDLTPDGQVLDAIEPGVSSEGYVLEKELTIKRSDCKLLDISSQDAWVFTNKIKVNFDATTEIGTFNCEYNFTSQAHMSGKILRSIGEYVRCIHIHNTHLRKHYALNNEKTLKTINNMYPSNENPRTKNNYINGCWRIRTKENYIDKNQELHEYSDFYVNDFRNLL